VTTKAPRLQKDGANPASAVPPATAPARAAAPAVALAPKSPAPANALGVKRPLPAKSVQKAANAFKNFNLSRFSKTSTPANYVPAARAKTHGGCSRAAQIDDGADRDTCCQPAPDPGVDSGPDAAKSGQTFSFAGSERQDRCQKRLIHPR
jgi:hypothetical protein